MKQLLKNNSGMTLVEILVVIAILATMTGGVGVSIAIAFSRNAEKCAKEIDVALERSRMYAMSKSGENTFTLSIGDLGNTTYISDLDETKSLQSRVNIVLDNDGTEEEIVSVRVTFDKSTGRVKSIFVNKDGSGDEAFSGNMLKISCFNDNRSKQASVVLIKNTGKHYVEYE